MLGSNSKILTTNRPLKLDGARREPQGSWMFSLNICGLRDYNASLVALKYENDVVGNTVMGGK